MEDFGGGGVLLVLVLLIVVVTGVKQSQLQVFRLRLKFDKIYWGQETVMMLKRFSLVCASMCISPSVCDLSAP